MPRRTKIVKRETLPDPRYGSVLVQQFINKLMMNGKKGLAESIVYEAFDKIHERTGRDALEVFETAMRNATPVIEVKPRRVGGATLQVPVPIEGPRRASLAIRWLLGASRSRNGRTMSDRLAAEVLDAFNNQGNTIKKKEDTHRMAEANKAFAHYRW
ncbi:MAG: 30S ribosomal protein S7 [Thermomicrobiales bacterium]